MTTMTATDLILGESLSSKAKQVYVYLAYRSNKENTCFPGLKRIARECSISISSVQRALNELVSEGLLKKQARQRNDGGQTSNLYILIEKIQERIAAKEEATKSKLDKLKNQQMTIKELCKKAYDERAGKENMSKAEGEKSGHPVICEELLKESLIGEVCKWKYISLSLRDKGFTGVSRGLMAIKKHFVR